MEDSDHSIPQVLVAYRQAVRTKDVKAFVALYDDAVRVFDMWGRWSFDGVDAWKSMVVGWFGSLGDEQVDVDFHDIHVTSTAELAAMHGFVSYIGLSADGKPLRSMHDRHTWLLKPDSAGAWKIIHEHSSGPVDFDTQKVIAVR